MTPREQKKQIVIDTIYGKQTVDVEATYGPFAVHQAHYGGYYNLTHIPTGLAVTFGAPTVKSGLQLARMLVRSGVRWNFTCKTRMPKRTRAMGVKVCERWQGEKPVLP